VSRNLGTLISLLAAALLSACGGGGDDAAAPSGAAGSKASQISGCASGDVAEMASLVYVVGDCAELKYAGTTVRNGEEVDIDGVRVGLFERGKWRVIENPPWAARDGAGLLVFKGELYLLGGWLLGPTTNEVWKTKDLRTWSWSPWRRGLVDTALHGSSTTIACSSSAATCSTTFGRRPTD
jgi:hypothetical protein